MPTMHVSLDTIVIRLLAATILSMVIGWERERRSKPAGLRTHMLVGLGAAAFFLVFIELALGPLKDAEGLELDPTRIFQGVITGIGFLGAGAIIQQRGRVLGATTGACIWTTGAIGVACGFGLYEHAVALTIVAALALTVLGLVERHLGIKQTDKDLE